MLQYSAWFGLCALSPYPAKLIINTIIAVIMSGEDNVDNLESKSWISRVTGEIQHVPCMRTAFLYGIGGGFAVGLTTFLFTSRVKRSTDLAVLSFTAATLGSFAYCRYNRARMLINQRKFQELQGLEPREVSYQFKSDR